MGIRYTNQITWGVIHGTCRKMTILRFVSLNLRPSTVATMMTSTQMECGEVWPSTGKKHKKQGCGDVNHTVYYWIWRQHPRRTWANCSFPMTTPPHDQRLQWTKATHICSWFSQLETLIRNFPASHVWLPELDVFLFLADEGKPGKNGTFHARKHVFPPALPCPEPVVKLIGDLLALQSRYGPPPPSGVCWFVCIIEHTESYRYPPRT